MTDADQKKLFQLFGKLRSTSSINTSGIGLGLSICKKIVETFEGNIVVSSKIGQGSTFTFSIKIPRDEHQSQDLNVHQIIIEGINAINYEGSHEEEQ
jgi:signal transduction histidine kinase